MNVGIIGLGKMGNAIAQRLAQTGNSVIGYDPYITKAPIKRSVSLAEIAQQEIIWLMIPADNVDSVLDQLMPHLSPKNIIIDGGNSFYKDSQRRAQTFEKKNISYLDCGTSGGIHGLRNGFCLMVGGNEQAYKRAAPIFKTLAAPHGYAYVGTSGAGHYVKMVHNGIEYTVMQGYAEGFSILNQSKDFPHLNLAQISGLWMHGSIIRSYLLELTHDLFKNNADFLTISGKVEEGGTGQWTTQEAQSLNIKTPGLDGALATRKESRKTGGSFTTKLIALLRNKFGGHPVKKI